MNIHEINPCIQLCEASSCCIYPFFENLTADELKQLTPDGVHIGDFDSFLELPTKRELRFMRRGVYFAKSKQEGYFSAAIAGACPNLGESGECTIYENRPSHCREYIVGGDSCNRARNRDGLKPLSELIKLTPNPKI